MLVKLYTITEDDQTMWLDFYITESLITGFYIPILEEDEDPSVNVRYDGDFLTLKQEPHLLNYLDRKHVKRLS